MLKGDLKRAIRAINDGLLTTLGGCGDVERNIMCCPAPWRDRFHAEIQRDVAALVRARPDHPRIQRDLARRRAAASNQPDPPDTLYGDRYLPRKFKTAIAIQGDNCVDIYANDLGLVAHPGADGALDGFDVLVGRRPRPDRQQAEHMAGGGATARVRARGQRCRGRRTVVAVQRDSATAPIAATRG